MAATTDGPEGLIGRVIAGYRLERVLGIGGAGAVYLGRSENNPDDEVAVKLLMPPMQLSLDERKEFHARFRREAQTLQQLNHPHILSIRAFGEDQGTGLSYMLLPYLSGGTLAAQLRLAGGPLTLNKVASYLTQLADALDYAHSKGVVHRDIKPSNILLDAQDHIYVADFGIAHLFDATRTTLTSTGQVLGTAAYMSPEQVKGEPVGPAADIYSVGVVVYELVTGRLPFTASVIFELMNKHALEVPPPPRRYRPDLPEPAQAAILRALAKRPEGRFSTAHALAQAFVAGLEGIWTEGLAAPELTLPATEGDPILYPPVLDLPPSFGGSLRRRSGLWAGIAVALIVILLGGLLVNKVGFGFAAHGIAGGGTPFASQPGATSDGGGNTSSIGAPTPTLPPTTTTTNTPVATSVATPTLTPVLIPTATDTPPSRSNCVPSGTSYYDDFSGHPIGSPPSGYFLRGASGAAPSIEDSGGTGPSYQVLSFPPIGGQYWDSWALKDGMVMCGSYTIAVKLNFQSSGDRAGVTIAWNDTNWDRIDIQPNIYFQNIEFRITYNGPISSNPSVTGSALNRYSLPMSVGTDYWIQIVATSNDPGHGQVAVNWSTDGVNFTQVVLATGLADLTGSAGVGTAGPNLPATNFDDFQIQAQ